MAYLIKINISDEADLRYCFIEADMRKKGAERYGCKFSTSLSSRSVATRRPSLLLLPAASRTRPTPGQPLQKGSA